MKSLKQALLALSVIAFAACGGSKSSSQNNQVTGTNYQGEPLFTVKGQLLTAGQQPSGPIRLAVAWYPDQSQTAAPQAIVTQDVQYTGSFPLNYTFSFFNTPPQSALSSYVEAGQTYKVAWGILMAYEDLNGDGQLNTIPVGGSPIDRILGTSIGDYYNGVTSPDYTYVAYVDGSAPPSWSGFGSGYNLWQNQQVVPSSTQVPLQLDNTNELNFLVCEEFVAGSSRSMDLPCNIAPTGGVRVTANVFLSDGQAGVSARITDGQNAITNAAVELNGQPVSYDPQYGLYYGFGGALTLNAPGDNVLKVTPAGGTAREFHVKAAADFSISAPVDSAMVKAGTQLQARWTKPADAQFYTVRAYALTPPYAPAFEELVYPNGTGTESFDFTVPAVNDYEQLDVVAFAKDYLARGLGGSTVNVATMRTRYLDVIPAAQQLSASGQVSVYHYGGQTFDTVYVRALDGVSETTTAQVEINGAAVSWSTDYQLYALESSGVLTLNGANTLTVKQSGKPDFSATVALPGDFTVTAPPTSVQVGGTISLSWTASAGATSYDVWASDANGNQLFFERTQNTSLDVTGFTASGMAYLSVAANGAAGERHLAGSVQYTYPVNVTP